MPAVLVTSGSGTCRVVCSSIPRSLRLSSWAIQSAARLLVLALQVVVCCDKNLKEKSNVTEQSDFCWSSLQSRLKVYQRLKTLMRCTSVSKRHGKNWTSALSILQLGSGTLAFLHVSRQKATAFSTSCLDRTMKCQTNSSVVAFWKRFLLRFPNFWSSASLTILPICHIANNIHDRVELVTHCFSQYCDSDVRHFRCLWLSVSCYTSSWNFIQFCCLQWKLYTRN